jgi:hypothetical protein
MKVKKLQYKTKVFAITLEYISNVPDIYLNVNT